MTKSLKIGFVSTAAAAALLALGALPVTAGKETGFTVAPLKAVSLDIGSKRAVSYFLADKGVCNLTVVLATATDGEVAPEAPGTRVQIPVQAGSVARIDAAAGQTGEFACDSSATKMSAKVIDRASWTAAKS